MMASVTLEVLTLPNDMQQFIKTTTGTSGTLFRVYGIFGKTTAACGARLFMGQLPPADVYGDGFHVVA